MPTIIDTADDTTNKLDQLKAAGVETIIRYDDRFPSGSWKQVHLAEIKAIQAAGLRLGIVYEDAGATASTFTEQNGYLAAAYSRLMASRRGQPDRSAVYFAVDFDATRAQINNRIIPYFRGVYRGFTEINDLPTLRVGAYCSGLCATILKAQHPDILIWITCSLGFAGSRDYVKAGKQDLFQSKCDTFLAGLSVDYDQANNADWGAFVPWSAEPAPDPVPKPPPTIAHDTSWLQQILKNYNLYHGEIDGRAGPLTIAAMIKYVELHEAVPGA